LRCNECVELASELCIAEMSVLSLSFKRMEVGSLLRKSVLSCPKRVWIAASEGVELDCGMLGI
jgi:hypothetical protein